MKKNIYLTCSSMSIISMFLTCGLLYKDCVQVRKIRTRKMILSLIADKSLINPEVNVAIFLFEM